MARPTLSDIARQVGYSKNTVSLALRGDRQIPEETREKIRKAAAKLGYQPNAVVSHLMAQLRASRLSDTMQRLMASSPTATPPQQASTSSSRGTTFGRASARATSTCITRGSSVLVSPLTWICRRAGLTRIAPRLNSAT